MCIKGLCLLLPIIEGVAEAVLQIARWMPHVRLEVDQALSS